MTASKQFRLGRTAFLRLSAIYAVVSGIVWIAGAIWIVRNGNDTKPLGWTSAYVAKQWIVRSVDAGGPADPLLRPGDKLLAIDGDSTVQRIGPGWILRDDPKRDSYRLTVQRDGAAIEQRIPWPIRKEAGLAAWLWIHLATGLVYYFVGLLIAFAKPESIAGRRAVLSSVLASAFFATSVFNPAGGLVGGPLLVVALLALFVRPLHLVAGYRFNAAFPLEERSTGKWLRFEQIVYIVSAIVWIPSVYAGILRALGPARASAIAASQFPFSLLHDAFIDSITILIAAVLSIANALVCLRNYRAVTDLDLRRRMRWVSIGVGVGMIPIFLVAPLLLIGYAAGKRVELLTVVRIINTTTVIIPACIGYAVLKHRVMGIRVVLRAGLRYVLARNSLRVALALPIALVAVSIIRHPNSTFSDLVLGASGRINLGLIGLAGLALAFRRPLLHAIDRRFFREAYQQDQIFVSLAEAVGRAADVTEISRLLSSQIQEAIHPRSIFAISAEDHDEFATLYSSSGQGDARALSSFHLTPSEFTHLSSSADVENFASLGVSARQCMETLGINLIVPIRGPNEGLVGLLLLGAKLSEEPYSRHDRRLLDTTAAQTGVVWENLRLRSRLKREQGVRRDVVAQLVSASGNADVLMECETCGACYDGSATVCANDGRELTASLAVSRILDGKYRLERLIGRGGMGAVYEASDLRLDRVVAVKVATGALFSDAIAMQRFAREARASAKLDHPNVVRAFDFGELPNALGAYLVLEHLRGVTLRRELQQRGTLPVDEALRVLHEIASGVAAAHARRIVHRDIKPENIFLARHDEGSVTKILDFGLAVVRDLGLEDRNRLTQTGAAVGTLAYMSVEQFLGEQVDERTDINALGVVTLEMISGNLDLKGPTFGRIAGIVDERLAGPSSTDEQRALARALKGALTESKDDRYPTIAVFRDEVLSALAKCSPVRLPVAGAPRAV